MVTYDKEYEELTFEKEETVYLNLLPSTLKILIFPDEFNEELKEDDLPKTLEVLVFGKRFNQQIKKNILPASLKVLIFGDDFHQILDKDTLPENLQILKFGLWYGENGENFEDNVLPKNLKILQTNKCISDVKKFPENLKKFIFNDSVDSKNKDTFDLNTLPKSTEFLDLQFVDGRFINLNLPKLKILKIGPINFNSLDNMPETLNYIEITDDYSYDEDHWEYVNYKKFPSNLEYLVLNENIMTFQDEDDNIEIFQKKIQNLKYLSIDGSEEQINILNTLPTDLPIIKFTKLSTEINNLPMNLKEIYLNNYFSKRYLKKIPFNCVVYIKDVYDIEIIENYLVNSKYPYSDHPKLISNNILNCDDIGIQYYSIKYL